MAISYHEKSLLSTPFWKIYGNLALLSMFLYKYEGFYIARYEAGVDGTTLKTSILPELEKILTPIP